MASFVSRLTPSGPLVEGYTTHGWRPTSAVIQPVWMATNGNTGDMRTRRWSHFMFLIFPLRSVNTSARMTVSMMSPYIITIRW